MMIIISMLTAYCIEIICFVLQESIGYMVVHKMKCISIYFYNW